MKLVSLQIKNFGCINNEGLTIKIDNIVVLIGANNVGKSTILRAYEAFKSAGSPLVRTDFYQQCESSPVEIIGTFGDITDSDKEQIGEKWLYEDNGDVVVRCKWQWNKSCEKGEKFSWDNNENEWKKGGMGGWDTIITGCIPTPLKVNPFDDTGQLEKQIVELLVSAVKDSTKSDQSKISPMITEINKLAQNIKQEMTGELEKTTNKLQTNLENIFPGHKVDIEPQAGKIDIEKILSSGTHLQIAGSDGKFYPLSNQGSGLQRVFLWSAIEALADSGKMKKGKNTIKDEEPRILLVEEPESFLHPPAIRSAREALYKIAELPNWQVIITTHSPIFIDVSKPHTTITRIEKSDVTSKTFSTDKADFSDDDRERLQIIRNCHPTVNEFFFANDIILVEGDTEQAALSESKLQDVTVLNCHGKANIPMFEKILNHFGVSYIVMHDLDTPKAQRGEEYINNAAWTVNKKIYNESLNGKDNIVIVNVPDFERQFFGYLQPGDKPYNALRELKKPERAAVVEELKSISCRKMEGVAERIVTSEDKYNEVGEQYCNKQRIEKSGVWNFS